LFFGGARQYLNAKRHSVSTTDEFRQIMEQVSGVPLSAFFQDWVYGEGHPTYDVRWNWRDSVLWVQTSQTTSAPTVTPVFRNKVPLGLVTSGPGQAPSLIQIEPAQGLQRIWIPRQVVSMSLDPNNTILKGTASSITRLSSLGAGLEEDPGQDWLQCYPNPGQGSLKVHLALPSTLLLRDMTGKVVWQGPGEEGWNRLDAVTAPGTYLLEAVSISGTRLIRRVSLR